MRLKPMLYRGMDRAQLDAAYDNLAAVPSPRNLFAEWATRSTRFRERHHQHLGLAYGERSRERLDLFLARNPAAPTMAYIHGGYWQMTFQTKELYSALAEGAVSHGLNVAMIEYTLAPEARMDWIVGEVRHAINWLYEHLGDYGADPGRIYVAGHSAGGHLTAMTMPLDVVRGGIAISGLYDLEPIRLNYLNETLRLDEAEARRNSPLLNFPPIPGPLIVTYGTAELPELCRQSIDYAQAWAERGLPGYLLPIDGADHFTILETLARPNGELMQALLSLVRG
jgi:arylformamidase